MAAVVVVNPEVQQEMKKNEIQEERECLQGNMPLGFCPACQLWSLALAPVMLTPAISYILFLYKIIKLLNVRINKKYHRGTPSLCHVCFGKKNQLVSHSNLVQFK